MFNVRTLSEFLVKFGSALIRPVYSTADEYMEVVSRYLADTHFVFDQERFAAFDEVVSLTAAPDAADIEMMIRLPYRLAAEKGCPYYIIMEEFQNILNDKEGEDALKVMEKVLADKESVSENERCYEYIISECDINKNKFVTNYYGDYQKTYARFFHYLLLLFVF